MPDAEGQGSRGVIHGYKPAGYFVQGTHADGRTVTGETRQCVHCTYVWEYKPGSGTKRGYCLHCHGLICMRGECHAEQKRLLSSFPELALSCLPFEDWNNRMREKLDRDPKWQVLPSGIAILVDAQ
jgi:hypothetical protein